MTDKEIGLKIKNGYDFTKEELVDIAFYERVTEHYNWNWMREKLENFDDYGIEDFSFIHFDIKDFKMVNELYDHFIADNLLRKVCNLMKKQDWIIYSCRCDNDNFAAMIKKMSDDDIKERLIKFFGEMAYLDEDPEYPVYFRCGVASINNVKDYRVYITDMAKMAQSRGTKVNETEVHFYTDQMKEDYVTGKIIKRELPHAIENGEFIVYLQPKYEPKNNTVVGAEALIRWNRKGEGILPPYKFIPYLERENVLEILDLYVLEKVCQYLTEWKEQGLPLIPISINMSKTQVYNPLAIKRIMNVVNKYNVDKKYIEFELTESLAYDDEAYMLSIMHELRKLGFQLSMDDFGTGFSSLNLLSNMPLTTLKIDKSFIDDISNGETKASYIIRDILNMTKHLMIKSVAEGVETEAQKDLVSSWGCNYIQGYYYSKPVPVEDFIKLLNK